MALPLSAGVYPTITDFPHFVAGLSTTRAGIVTTADRGPVNKPTRVSDSDGMIRVFGKPTLQHMGLYGGLQYLSRGSFLLINRVGNFSKTGALVGTELFDQNASVSVNEQTNTDPTLTIYSKYPGIDYNGTKVTIIAGASTGAVTIIVDFNNGEIFERIEEVIVNDPLSPRFIEKVINNAASAEASQVIYVDYLPADKGLPKLGVYELTGGANGTAGLTDSDYIGSSFSVTYNGPSGMQTFADTEQYSLSMLAVPGISSAAVINAGGALMDLRNSGLYIIDPPEGLDANSVIDWHNGVAPFDDHQAFNSKRFAIYWPWLTILDSEVSKQEINLPPSGFAMAQWAYTDQFFEPWFAPAGITRGHLLKPLRAEFQPNQGDRDALQSGGNVINPIRTFLTLGLNIWGQRTALRTSSQDTTSVFRSINVMRLTDFIKDSIANSTQILTFESNDELLWNQFSNTVVPFLKDIASRRGLEDFRVTADATTTTSQAKNNLEMRAKVSFIPIQVAEKISINFAVLPSGTTFSDAQ